MMLTELANWLRAADLRVEEVAGWQDRGHGEIRNDAANIVDVSHHTAGGPNGRAPSLSTCLYGVPGVPGPLCNILQTREADGNDVFMVLAAGVSYNAGTGGFAGVSGNWSTVGTECEHTGVDPFPDHRAELRQRAAAAILKGLGQPDGSRSCQHFEWSDTGKIDIGTPKVDANLWRQRITEFMQGAPAPKPPDPTPPRPQEEAMHIVCGPRQGMIGQVAYLLDGDQLLVEWNGNDVSGFGAVMPAKCRDFLNGTSGITYQQMVPDSDPHLNDLRSKIMTEIRWPGGHERPVKPIEIHD